MEEPSTFFVDDGPNRVRAVTRQIGLTTFVGHDSPITFDLVVGLDDLDSISQSIINQTYSAPSNFQMMFELIRPGCRVLDLGAHIGTFALAAAAAGCQVVAVEASPHNIALLNESVARNHFSQLTVVHAAVSDHVGRLDFVQNGPHGIVARPVLNATTVTVPALTVDLILKQLGIDRVDLIKMDIEGSEAAAIHGMPALLSGPDAPPIFYESNGHTLRIFDQTPYTLKGSLSELGYNNYLCEMQQLIPTQPDELQVECIVDYLAVKQFPGQLRRWRRTKPLSRQALIQRVLEQSQHSNPDHRAFLARTLELKGRHLLTDVRVRAALTTLSRDADPEVRAAAAWVPQWAARPYPRAARTRPVPPTSKLRIGIDYRILSSGINLNRGMGRYTQQQLREVLKLDPHNDYVLFCPPESDLFLILPEIRSAPNVSIATIEVSADKAVSEPNPPEKILRFAEEYQDWIYRQRVDLYHATTPFSWHETVLPYFDACPMVATFYDAIPLIFSDKYFPPQDPIGAVYSRAIQFVHDARRFVAISHSARQDASRYFGLPAERIDVAYPIADPWFQVLPEEEVSPRLRELRRRVGLPGQFVLAVPHLHHSKGLDVLLDAYALVPLEIRRQLPLVITCHLTSFEDQYLRSLAQSRGISDSLVITGYVSNEEMAALYNAATMLVHASRYEGFGLPVLEAMRCGAPVITMAASALPEVGGEAAVLIEPGDLSGIAQAIESLYLDPDRRKDMSRLGLEQAAKFSPSQLGQETLDCYYRALQPGAAAEPAKPHLALWTPLPPQHSGVADYSANVLLGALARWYDIEVFVDDDVWPAWDVLRSFRVLHHSAFARRHAQRPFDLTVYQLGASLFHVYMYRYLQQYPGVVVLHDLTWSYAIYADLVLPGRTAQFLEELRDCEGPEAVKQFRQISQAPDNVRQSQLIAFLDQHLMLTKIVEHSLGLIVHMEASAVELRQRFAEHAEQVFVVPHGAEDTYRESPEPRCQASRAALGIADEAFVVGVFGILDPVKRVETTLRAFAQLLAAHPWARLVIVGEAPDPLYQDTLRSLTDFLGIAASVTFTGYVSADNLKQWLLACDVVVNLRYPSRKQMSGTLVRAIAAGQPVIITDLPEWRFLPEEFVWRIAPDEREVETLADDLGRLATNPALRAALSVKARAYYEKELSPWQMAERYRAVFKQIGGERLAPPLPAQALGTAVLALNKPIEIEDFELAAVAAPIRELFAAEADFYPPAFPQGAEYGRFWRAAMALHTLDQAGHLRRDAVILVIGAGRHPLPYYLTGQVGQVFAIDRYLETGQAGSQALAQPEFEAAYGVDLNRLVVQHMDARALRFPDQSFDAVIVCQAPGQLGTQADLASAMYEIGRVLKPAGVVSLTIEHLFAGPATQAGANPSQPFLSREDIDHFVVAASGLELMDALRTEPSERTLAMPRRLDLRQRDLVEDESGPPQFVTVIGGNVATLLHLALHKTAVYPQADNGWAKPAPELLEEIRHASSVVATQKNTIPPPGNRLGSISVHSSKTMPAMNDTRSGSLDVVRARLKTWNQIRLKGWYDSRLRRLPAPIAYLVRTFTRVLYLGHSEQAQAYFFEPLLDHLAEVDAQVAEANAHAQELSQGLSALSGVQESLRQDSARQIERITADFQNSEQQLTSQLAQQRTQQKQQSARLEQQAAQQEQRIAQLEQHIAQLEQQAAQQGQRTAQLEQNAAQQAQNAAQQEQRAVQLEQSAAQQAQNAARQEQQLQQLEQELRLRIATEADVATRLARYDAALVGVQSDLERLHALTDPSIAEGQRQHFAVLEEQLRQITSRVRWLSQVLAVTPPSGSPGSVELTADELVNLLQQLEQRVPVLAGLRSVDLSLQTGNSDTLFAGAAYLGERLSSKGSVYRAPNDLCYHVDFTADWDRSVLFASAAARLAPGGCFVLVTAPERSQPAGHPQLEFVTEHEIRLESGKSVRAYVWRKRPEPA